MPSRPAMVERQPIHRDHASLVYGTAPEQRLAIAAYVRAGLDRGERCVYILSDSALIEVVDALDEGGVDVPVEAARGSFRMLRAQQIYLRAGTFDASATIELIGAAVKDALADGYTGLRAAGEMEWVLGAGASLAALVSYEERLNTTVFAAGRLTGLCLYDSRRFRPDWLQAIERAHPRRLPETELLPAAASRIMTHSSRQPDHAPHTAQQASFSQVR